MIAKSIKTPGGTTIWIARQSIKGTDIFAAGETLSDALRALTQRPECLQALKNDVLTRARRTISECQRSAYR